MSQNLSGLERFKKPRSLDEFSVYLRKRKEHSAKDLENLARKFNIEVLNLNSLKNEIREAIGKNFDYFSTTIHLRPRAIDFLKLGLKRIEEATKIATETETESKTFYYPVYYQKFEEERPDLIDIGTEIKISLLDILKFNKNKKDFEYSIDFHEALLNYLENYDYEKELDEKILKILEKKFSNYPKEQKKILIDYCTLTIKNILQDYKEFFSNSNLSFAFTKENILNLNANIAKIFLNHFDDIKEILSETSITYEDLQSIENKKNFEIKSDFLFLTCLLGGYVHIGAEYGKLNQLRERLGLSALEETKSPQERFNIFEIKEIESGTLRFLFGDPESFIYTATYLGKEEIVTSPISQKVRERIRVVDFYHKIKKFNLDKILNDENIKLSRENFKEILEAINYFTYLSEEEKPTVLEIISNLEENQQNLFTWLQKFNETVNSDEKISKRFLIKEGIFKTKLLLFIFESYVKNNLKGILFESIKEVFNKQIVIEKTEFLKEAKFGGIEPAIPILDLKEEDIKNLSILIYIQENNFSHESWKKLNLLTNINFLSPKDTSYQSV
jgi:hypothetical protein